VIEPRNSIVVVRKGNREAAKPRGKADAVHPAKAAVLGSETPVQHPAAILQDTTGV